jgi:hypothetical protein
MLNHINSINKSAKSYKVKTLIKKLFLFDLKTGTKSLEQLVPAVENPATTEDPFQAPFSLRQQRALKKNGSVELEGKLCI